MYLTDLINLDSGRTYSDEGFLKVPARIARIGVQEYSPEEMGLEDRDPTDVIRVLRKEADVFDELSLNSFASKPVTNDHPPVLVTPDNSKKYTVGLTADKITRNGEYVETVLVITDAEMIANIKDGKTELSNGYTADIVWEKGQDSKYGEYDAIQTNIKGNHIAIVDKARAGEACRLSDKQTPKSKEPIMVKVKIDGVDYEMDEQAAQAVQKLMAKMKTAEDEAMQKETDMQKEKEDMEVEGKKNEDALQAQLDEAKSKILSDAELDTRVATRTNIVYAVKRIVPDLDCTGKDNDTIKKAVVQAKCPDLVLDKVSVDYINARFDAIVDSGVTANVNTIDAALQTAILNKDGTTIDNRPADVIAREKFMTNSKNAWKPKGAAQ